MGSRFDFILRWRPLIVVLVILLPHVSSVVVQHRSSQTDAKHSRRGRNRNAANKDRSAAVQSMLAAQQSEMEGVFNDTKLEMLIALNNTIRPVGVDGETIEIAPNGSITHTTFIRSKAAQIVVSLATAPVQVAQLGGAVLALKAKIFGKAVERALDHGFQHAVDGNLTGAVYAPIEAMARAVEENDVINSQASAAAEGSFGIILVFAFIGSCWLAEALLTARAEAAAAAAQACKLAQHGETLASSALNWKEDSSGFRHALSFARYLLAWHVVFDNFYMRGDGRTTSSMGRPWAVFARWGIIAAPGFFILAGFSHTYSKMTASHSDRNRDEDFFYAMTRRVASWYPLYALSVTWCAVRLSSLEAEDWSQYLADMFLIRGWIWSANDGFPYMIGDWWMCFLMVYLLLFSPMHQVLVSCTNSVLWTMLTVACMCVIPFSLLEWYCAETSPLMSLVQYWPTFILGQALAVWFVRNCMQQKAVATSSLAAGWAAQSPPVSTISSARPLGKRFGGFGKSQPIDRGIEKQLKTWEPGAVTYVMRPVHEIPAPCRFGVTLSSVVLGLSFFSFSPYDMVPIINKPVLPLLLKGGLAPVQGLLVLGLACECDPMAKVFARKPFRYAERLAFTTFVFQVPIHNAVSDFTGWDGLTWTFTITLAIFSIFAHYYMEQPWRRLLGLKDK